MYELRYNQRQFAMAVGVSPQAINNVIAERTKTPSSDLLQAITKAFPQVNPTWLLTGTGSMLLEKELKEEKPVPQEMPSINPILEELKLMRQELGRAMRIIESQQELLRKHSGSRERTMPSVKKVA
jgi:transcriptional regulator with XRE-family HTH domain